MSTASRRLLLHRAQQQPQQQGSREEEGEEEDSRWSTFNSALPNHNLSLNHNRKPTLRPPPAPTREESRLCQLPEETLSSVRLLATAAKTSPSNNLFHHSIIMLLCRSFCSLHVNSFCSFATQDHISCSRLISGVKVTRIILYFVLRRHLACPGISNMFLVVFIH